MSYIAARLKFRIHFWMFVLSDFNCSQSDFVTIICQIVYRSAVERTVVESV